MDHQRPLTRLLIAGALVALAVAGVLWLKAPGKQSARATPAAESAASDERENTPVATQKPPAVETTEAHADEGPTQRSSYDPSIHPHPITPEGDRLHREVALLDDAWLAVKGKDFAKARELVATHQREYPASNAHMDEGLLVLADCMERPGPDTRAKAQQYYDSRTFSQMRKRIRRLCLEVVPE
jgi:hypothetical protein